MDSTGPSQIIEAERSAYLEELSEADPDWPADVRAVYRKLRDRLFDWGGVEAQKILADCGIRGHDVYSRFRHVTGHGIKEFVVHHRIELAKRLLRYESLTVSQVAMAVGYDSPGGFCATFKRHSGKTPGAFRQESGSRKEEWS